VTTLQSETERHQQREGQVAWSVRGWCRDTSLGPTTVFGLIADGKIESVKLGKKRLILTRPADFLARLRDGA
jgi:hypothetical protein